MICLESNFSGGHLGYALGNDPEELSYALKELSQNFAAAELGADLDGYFGAGDAKSVADYLRALAEAICPKEAM